MRKVKIQCTIGPSCNDPQILKDMIRDGEPVSLYELAVKYQTTVSTVRRDIVKLMDIGMIGEYGKDGHRQLYAYRPKK